MSEIKKVEGWALRAPFVIETEKATGYHYSLYQSYDFGTRMYFVFGGDGKMSSHPFNVLDKEAVNRARRILLELGGTDPHAAEEKRVRGLRSPLEPKT